MYGTQILVLDFGGLEMDYDALKSFFGENMQVISGSMCVGGLVGVMRGYSKLKSGKVGKLVTVKTVVSKKNTLSDNLKDMLIGTYGDTLQDLFGDKFGQVDGIGVAGGVVGTATGHAEVGTSAAEQDLLKQLTKTLINYIFDVENGSKDGFLQGAGKTEGWIAGSLVGKLVEDASIIGGTTGYLVSGSVYAGGIVGYMDTREGISGVQNYTDLSSYAGLKGVYFINGIGIEGGEQCYDGSSPEEDEEDDTSKYLKTSLGGVLGYYHNGSIDVSKTTPMSVVGFSTEFNDLVSDKYFAGGVVGHVHNADVDDSLLTKNGLSVVTGTFSYAGAIVGRISGEKVNISISVDTANESGLSGKTVVALKGAGGIAGAITNNSKMTATSTSIDITATEATLKIENMYNSDSITAVAVGGVVGAILSDSTLKLVNNVSVSGKLTGTYIGGVAGIIAKGGTLDGGGFTVTVNKQTDKDGNAEETAFDDQKSASIGGIVGSLDGGTVQNINNGIRIIGSHTATVGGIAGVMTGGTISNCNNAMEVSLFDGENPARSDNPWANQSNKQDITNTGAESYEDFIEYLRGSVGGIVGKVSVFSFSQLITLSNFNITNFLGTSAKIKDCNSTGSVSGYFFYGSDANAVVDKDQNSGTSSDEQSYKIRIADKRGRFVGTTQKFGAVDITGGNSENKGVFADFNFDELFTAETLWELLTTDVNKLDEFITGKVTKGNVYASYATDWDQKNDEEKAFVKGYKIEAKSYSFTTDGQGNLTRSEDQTAETRYNFKVATGQDGRDVERLDASGAQANYGLGTPSTNQKMAAQKVALTEALKEPSVGVYNVDVISKEQSGSSYTVDTGAGVEPAAMTTYYKFTVTHYSYSLATINVVVSETYQKLQNCGANISFTRKTDTKQGYVSDSGARALLLERLYSNNTIEKFAIDLINKCFEIIT